MRPRLGDILTRDPVEVRPDETLAEARRLMAEHRVRRLPVCKGDELVVVASDSETSFSASPTAPGEASATATSPIEKTLLSTAMTDRPHATPGVNAHSHSNTVSGLPWFQFPRKP